MKLSKWIEHKTLQNLSMYIVNLSRGVWTIARWGFDMKSIPWVGGLSEYTCSRDKAFNSFLQKGKEKLTTTCTPEELGKCLTYNEIFNTCTSAKSLTMLKIKASVL